MSALEFIFALQVNKGNLTPVDQPLEQYLKIG